MKGSQAGWIIIDKAPIMVEVSWHDCEPERGVYDFAKLDIMTTVYAGHDLYVRIKNTPPWAVRPEYAGIQCAPPQKVYYPDYIEFCKQVALRSGAKGLCIWNEPDVDPNLVFSMGLDKFFGGWGNPLEMYYGGMTYGAFFRQVYTSLKYWRRTLQVIGGEFMFATPESKSFVSGFLRAGARPDLVSFHCYAGFPQYDPTVLNNAVNEITVILNQYRALRPLWITEISVRKQGEETAEHVQAQTDYAMYLIRNYTRLGIQAAFWYTGCWEAWENTDLIGKNPETGEKYKKSTWYLVDKYVRLGVV